MLFLSWMHRLWLIASKEYPFYLVSPLLLGTVTICMPIWLMFLLFLLVVIVMRLRMSLLRLPKLWGLVLGREIPKILWYGPCLILFCYLNIWKLNFKKKKKNLLGGWQPLAHISVTMIALQLCIDLKYNIIVRNPMCF